MVKIQDNDNYRIVVISDIHGHLNHLKSLLERVDLRETDYLIILGDFINKGPESYNTYKYMQELEKRERTIILKGNHEYFIYYGLTNREFSDRFFNYLKEGHFSTIVEDFLKYKNLNLNSFFNGEEFQDFLHLEYADFFNYIESLPIIVENEDFIFVHGGYDQSFDLIEEEGKFLKFDDYNKVAGTQDKKVVVGHWPTCNLRDNFHSNIPFFNENKNIISIDGGLGVKSAGELNALVITKSNGVIQYNYIQENNFDKVKIIKKSKLPKEEKIYINYPNYEFEIIKKENTMSFCRHLESGKEFTVFNSLIEDKDGVYRLKTSFVNNFLDLEIGELVEVALSFEDCLLVKHGKEFGWIKKEQVEFEINTKY